MSKIYPAEAATLMILRPIVAIGCLMFGLSRILSCVLIIWSGRLMADNLYSFIGILLAGILNIAACYLLLRVPMVLDIKE